MIFHNTIYQLLLPEIVVASFIGIIIIIDVIIVKKFKFIIYLLSQIGLLITFYLIWQNCVLGVKEGNNFIVQHGFMWRVEINYLKLVMVALAMVILAYLKNYLNYMNSKYYGEFVALNLFVLLGSMLLISSNHFFNFYFSMEMMFIATYILIGIEQNSKNLEGLVKYIVVSIIFSGLFLYGLSLIYGATGGLDFYTIAEFVKHQYINSIFNIGISLALIGILFKLHIFPFQLWVPNFYQISSPVIIMLTASLPKIALISMLSYLFADILFNYINIYWKPLIILISLCSIFIGNFGAIMQSELKRILAYAAIANIGFVVLGLVNNTVEGIFATKFYIISYVVVMVNVLGCLIILNANNHMADIKDLIGLSKNYPWVSAMLLILLLSLVGLPPTIGFYAKFLIIKSLIKIDLIPVAVIATILSAINIVYCLNIIKYMYFIDAGDPYKSPTNVVTINLRNYAIIGLLTINSGVVLLIGFFRLWKL